MIIVILKCRHCKLNFSINVNVQGAILRKYCETCAPIVNKINARERRRRLAIEKSK